MLCVPAGKKNYQFEVTVKLEELTSVPFVNGVMFAKLRLLDSRNSKQYSAREPIKDHKVMWNSTHKFPCRLIANLQSSMLEPSELKVSIRKEAKGGKSYRKMGYVLINVACFANKGSKPCRRRYILESYNPDRRRQDNSMLSMSFTVCQVFGDPCFRVPDEDTSKCVPYESLLITGGGGGGGGSAVGSPIPDDMVCPSSNAREDGDVVNDVDSQTDDLNDDEGDIEDRIVLLDSTENTDTLDEHSTAVATAGPSLLQQFYQTTPNHHYSSCSNNSNSSGNINYINPGGSSSINTNNSGGNVVVPNSRMLLLHHHFPMSEESPFPSIMYSDNMVSTVPKQANRTPRLPQNIPGYSTCPHNLGNSNSSSSNSRNLYMPVATGGASSYSSGAAPGGCSTGAGNSNNQAISARSLSLYQRQQQQQQQQQQHFQLQQLHLMQQQHMQQQSRLASHRMAMLGHTPSLDGSSCNAPPRTLSSSSGYCTHSRHSSNESAASFRSPQMCPTNSLDACNESETVS